MNDKKRTVLTHIATWIVLWAMTTFLAVTEAGPLERLIAGTVIIAATMTVVYCAFWIYDHPPKRPGRWSTLFAYGVVMSLVTHYIAHTFGGTFPISQSFLNVFLVTGLALASRQGGRAVTAQRNARRAEELRKSAEQRALNARLAPHTLFNMLNAIYAASLKEPARASELILSLASMMRHLTDSADRDFTDAGAELSFIKNYAELMAERGGQSSEISLDFPEDVDTRVPNLLCATLFENAVTHGRQDDGSVTISAQFRETDEGFSFHVKNRMSTARKQKSAGLSSGLSSVRARLNYLFPDNHKFTAAPQGDEWFYAEIETW